MAKLYPPTIENFAFYGNLIEVPFIHNMGVSNSQVKSYNLRFKTINTNQIFLELQNGIANKDKVFFILSDEQKNKFNIGQYYKVQMAYVNKNNQIGYYSTLCIARYSSPIGECIVENNILSPNSFNITVDRGTEDIYDSLYTYQIDLIECFQNNEEEEMKIIASSGIQKFDILNDSINSKYNAIYNFNKIFINYSENLYFLKIKVKTINGVEKEYDPIKINYTIGNLFNNNEVRFIVENNFDYGYIKIKSIFQNQGSYGYLSRLVDNEYECIGILYDGQTFYDFNIEQGKEYFYFLGKDKYYSGDYISKLDTYSVKKILADYEDMSLWDGQKLLRLKFNPQISSYKTTRLEQKIETLGSKYPFVFYNSVVGYKEFPISGFITKEMDEEGWFLQFTKNNYRRESSVSLSDFNNVINLSKDIKDERIFKNKVLDWLNNGKPKLFKSPQEGNFIVNIINVSMTPNDILARRMHSVSMSAIEIDELSYENLNKYELNNIIVKQNEDNDFYSIDISDYNETIPVSSFNKASNTKFGIVKGNENKVSITDGEFNSVNTDSLRQGIKIIYIGDVEEISPQLDEITNRDDKASNNSFGKVIGDPLKVSITNGEIDYVNLDIIESDDNFLVGNIESTIEYDQEEITSDLAQNDKYGLIKGHNGQISIVDGNIQSIDISKLKALDENNENIELIIGGE